MRTLRFIVATLVLVTLRRQIRDDVSPSYAVPGFKIRQIFFGAERSGGAVLAKISGAERSGGAVLSKKFGAERSGGAEIS